MEKRNPYIQKFIRNRRYLSLTAVVLLMVMFMVVVVTLGTPAVRAATGDFSIDFAAAAPDTYDHLTGGGVYNDGTKDYVVESLEGGDFACGDSVTFFAAVTVDQGATDGPQTIEMDFSFLMNTTGQPGVAISAFNLVQVNDGDPFNTGDDGSTASLIAFDDSDPLFTPGSVLEGTVELDDLEAGEQVVVRIDVELACDPGSAPTGNLQAALGAARLTSPEVGDIPSGGQTIPFKLVSQILFPGLNLFKSVSSDIKGCPGVQTLPVPVGTTVYYCFQIRNNGEANLLNISLIDNQFPEVNIGLLSGFSDEDGDGEYDDLAPGASAENYGNPRAHVADQNITNIATAGGSGLTDTASCTVIVYSADFGDLSCDSLNDYCLTEFSDDGARHEIGDLWLGTQPDHETDGWVSDLADGDDNNGGDDEDGVSLPAGYNWSDGEGELNVDVNGTGCLTAWLDFTDGTVFEYNHFFTDTYQTYDELIIDNELMLPGPNEVTFDLPVDAANGGYFFGRFRLVPALMDGDTYFCGEAPGLTGYWLNGEVEDYLFIFGPNAVTLTEFDASSNSGVPTIWLAALALLGMALLGFTITRVLRFNFSFSKKMS